MTREARLALVLLLNVVLVAGLLAVGLKAHSLGVLAAGADYLADAGAIGVSLLAIRLSRRSPTPARPLGYPKATTIAAGVNGGWLFVLCLLVLAEATRRLVGGAPSVRGWPVLIASAVAAIVMLVGALILRGDEAPADGAGDDLNMRAVLLDTAGDAAAAAGVAVSGGIIIATGRYDWLDPAAALVIAVIIGGHAVALLIAVSGELKRLTRDDAERDQC